jgi:hypothetical protein
MNRGNFTNGTDQSRQASLVTSNDSADWVFRTAYCTFGNVLPTSSTSMTFPITSTKLVFAPPSPLFFVVHMLGGCLRRHVLVTITVQAPRDPPLYIIK